MDNENKIIFKLLNLIIFIVIFSLFFYLFKIEFTLFNLELNLDKIYQGNLKEYKSLYLIYYPVISLSFTTYLFYRIIIGFFINSLFVSLFTREYFNFLFVRWKIYTFIIAFFFLFTLASLDLVDYGYLTINRFGTTFLFSICIITFFTAPWTIGNITRYFFSLNSNLRVSFPLTSIILLLFCSSWFYDFYYLFVREGIYPKTWFYNLTRSVPIYITAGLFWNLTYDFLNKKTTFKFISQKKIWFNTKERVFYDTNISLSIFIKKFSTFAIPILIFFFFFTFNSVNFYKVLQFTEVILKDGKEITKITFNFNKPYEYIPEIQIQETNNIAINEKDKNLNLGNYHALLLGVDTYDISLGNLDTPSTDINAISKILKQKYNFKVRKLLNPTRKEIIIAIENYRENLEFNDNFLIYYAGHGILDVNGNEGYWQPSDAIKSSQANWISNSWIKSQLNAIKAKHIILIVDSCFSSSIFKGNENNISKDKINNNYLNKISNKITRKALTAGGLEPVLDGGGGIYSVFAKALLSVLSNNNDPLLGTQLYTELSKNLIFNAAQTPTYEVIDKTGHVMGGDFVFVPSNN